ncbi:uncharacterized protein CLUP02_14702 [Colletotrichum lupini]|uniref:Uncharacterized protein n=1 Tax=Colletotrichum lupini TaxID=145971 RepID=A0A9Q8T4I8_9PEZI|nr:uncharacterized protein CLUP02_14702 [Colletotrichum lupini]UQC89174.1 hypothetical protein CLUP02_14702 [Colletotrichum lupini]
MSGRQASLRNAYNHHDRNSAEGKAGRRPRTLLPIKVTIEYDIQPFSIGETLRDTALSMTVLQLLLISTTARAETEFPMQVDSYKAVKTKKKEMAYAADSGAVEIMGS